jgi:acetyl/propionyl-CoA carboxylase alpha subunit
MNELTVTGITTNRSFLLALLADANVIEDQFTTVYVEQEFLGRMQRQTEKAVN